MKFKSPLLSILALSLLPSLALAEVTPHALTFSLGGGYIFFAPKRDLSNTTVPTYAALAYNYDQKWASEVAVNLLNVNSHRANNRHAHGFIYLFDQLYRFPTTHKIDPYVMGGFNIISLKPIVNQAVSQGGANIGVGAQFWKSRYVAVVAEGRDIYTFSGGKNDFLLNLGFNFIWE